jgi:hypothetical protein
MQNKTKPKDNQDSFNRVWQHFIVEKHTKSVGFAPGGKLGTRCRYRTDNGLNGCAIGCQLPDRNAKRADKMKEGAIDSVLRKSRVIAQWFSNVNGDLLCQLQDAHDTRFETLGNALANIAKDFNLTVPKQST